MISRLVFGLLVLCSMQSIAKQDVLAGYFHNWSSEAYNYTLDQVQANKLTHLLYQCAQVSQQSTIELCDDFLDSAIWYEQDANPLYRGGLGQLLKLKHQHPKLKTLISVGGWYRSSQYSTMAKSYESRQRFIQSVLALLAQYQLDGIEFNWQFPGLSTADKTDVDAQDGENFLLLLQEFRAAMQAENLEYIVMVVAGVDNETSGNWPLRHIAAWVDFAVINAGYMNGAWSYVTGHISPLYQNPNAPDFYNNVHRTVEWLANQGLPREQMILMIPSHAAGWQKNSSAQ